MKSILLECRTEFCIGSVRVGVLQFWLSSAGQKSPVPTGLTQSEPLKVRYLLVFFHYQERASSHKSGTVEPVKNVPQMEAVIREQLNMGITMEALAVRDFVTWP